MGRGEEDAAALAERKRGKRRGSSRRRSRSARKGKVDEDGAATGEKRGDADGAGESAVQLSLRRRLRPLQLGQLVTLVPTLVALLRGSHEFAGDLFLAAEDDATRFEAQAFLRELLNDLNVRGDLSITQLRTVFATYQPRVVTSALRVVLLECEPRFVPRDIADNLIASLGTLDECETGVECAKVIGGMLDDMPRTHFMALGEIAAFLRDACRDPTELACLIGPALLSDSRQSVEEDDQTARAAAAMMDLLIEEADLIFGRVAGKVTSHPSSRSFVALGERRPVSGRLKDSKNGDYFRSQVKHTRTLPRNTNSDTSRLAARQAQLITFYNWRDPMKASRVPLLFENHDFLDIAKAIHLKYPESMPPQWRAELTEMKESGKTAEISWFDPGRTKNDGPVTLMKESERSKIDKIIDEFIDTEQMYYNQLSETVAFAKHIKNIARGFKGSEARSKLQLDAKKIDSLFGMRLRDIVDLSERFLANLEVIDLVRTAPKCEMDRPGLLADAILAVIDDLHVYAPYVSMHRTNDVLLKKQIALVRKRPSGPARLGKGLVGAAAGKYKGSFLDIWEQITSLSSVLRGQSLESVLIMPVQRIPRWVILMKELVRKLPAGHPAETKVNEVCEMVNDICDQLNSAMRQHEKIAAILGEDRIEPTGSKHNHLRRGSNKNLMANVYDRRPTTDGEDSFGEH